MGKIDELKEKVKGNKKRIILPESNDSRILSAASILMKEDLVDIILIGKKEVSEEYEILNNATWYNPEDVVEEYTNKLFELRKEKGMTKEEARNLILNDYMYFSCLLVLEGRADGIVSGISHSSSNTLRPALQLIKGPDGFVSSFFLMETDKYDLGENGLFIFADCGLNQNPTPNELAIIGKQAIASYKEFIGNNPKVAYLSHSTYGSSKHEMVDKIKLAVEESKKINTDCIIDGELQLDAAIIPDVANIKCPGSPLKGKANILVFPNLDSGNIGYKLVERFGNAKAYGPLTQGLNYPVNDLSRGSSVDDIIGVILITSIQASKNVL